MPDYNLVALCLLVVGMVVIPAVVLFGVYNSNTLPNLGRDRVTFRTPIALTITFVMMLLLLPAFGAVVLVDEIADIVAEHDNLMVTVGWSAAFAAMYIGLPLTIALALFGMMPGPQELRLDRKQQTYDLRFGTFLKRRRRSGTWGDIEGIAIKKISARSVSYRVDVAWRHGLSGGPSLALTAKREQAEMMARKISQELGLKVVSHF